MILFVNNGRFKNRGKQSYSEKIIQVLTSRNIPFYSVDRIEPLPKGIRQKIRGILLGGSNLELSDPNTDYKWYEHNLHYMQMFPDVPVYGICFGCQLLALYYGGKIVHGEYYKESNETQIDLSSPLFSNGFERNSVCKYYFSDQIVPFSSKSGVKEIAWVSKKEQRIPVGFEFAKDRWGTIFHPEFYKKTGVIFENFARFCGSI